MSDTLTQTDTAPRAEPKAERGHRHGDFIWYELLATDPDAAADFYAKVIGWEARDAGQPGMDYRLLSIGGADVAGLMKREETMPPPVWLGYIGVDDVDLAVAKIEKAGGAVHVPPTDIPNVGRFAFVADPQGILFYVMRGSNDQPSQAFKPMVDGHGSWNELVTTDQAAAFDFYLDQFGWEKGDAMPMGEAGDYRFLNHHGEMFGAVMNRIDNSNSMESNQPPGWNYYFRVPSIEKAAETIRGNGGTITFGPQEVPGGDYVINATDPQGAAFGLVGPQR